MIPCTTGKRHIYSFVRNVTIRRGRANHWQISKRGLYRCACGARRYGEIVSRKTEQQQECDQ